MSNHKAESSIYILTCLPSYILILRRLANISTETHLSYSECIWGHWITTALQYIHWIYDSSITTWVWKDTWCIQWGEWHLARLLNWATLHSAGVDDVPHFAYKLCKQLQHAALSRINTCHILMAYRLSFVLLVYIRHCCSKWCTCSVTHTMIQFRLGQNDINLFCKTVYHEGTAVKLLWVQQTVHHLSNVLICSLLPSPGRKQEVQPVMDFVRKASIISCRFIVKQGVKKFKQNKTLLVTNLLGVCEYYT